MRTLFTLIFFYFTVLCNYNAVAQYIISGSITDAHGKGVPYASAILQRLPDSSIQLTTIADSMGNYKLDVPKLGRSYISISAAGYAGTSKTVADITATRQKIDFAMEQESKELKEVAVTTKKPLIKRKADRIIFNVENSLTSIGGDALDALGKAPGVRVSNANDISISGKSTVSIMINDKLMTMGGNELAEILRTIPSENVTRIEVITTPPAKYDAAGNSGLINIVTKKSNKKGLNGTVGTNIIQNSLLSGIGVSTLNYRNNKLNVYALSNGGDNFSKPVERSNTFYPVQQLNQVSNIENLRNFQYNQVGIDYNVNSKTIIGLQYTYAWSKPRMNEDINGRWVNAANGIDSIINTRAHTRDYGERNVVNLNYEHKFDSTGRKLNMDGDFFTRIGRTVRDFTTTDVLGVGSPTGYNSINQSTGKQVLYIGSLKADVALPTKFADLSFGAKGSFIHVLSDNVFSYIANGAYVVDPGKTNKFDYQENTEAAYFSAQKKLNKQWDAQAGLRAEYTQTRAASLTLATANETKYLQLFPTGYLQYALNEDNVFNLNYSRRIDRPNMSMINPFRRYMTPTSYDEGNPFLQPSFTSNVELSYTLQSKYTFSTYIQHTTQAATQILEIDSVNKGYHFRYANIGNSLNYGVTASASLQPTKWWESNIEFYGFHARVNANYYNTGIYTHYDMTGFVAEGDNNFTLNKEKTLLAEAGFAYSSAMIEHYNFHYPQLTVNAGMRALFFNKNLVIGFAVGDIFRTEFVKVRNLYNSSTTNNYYDERDVRVNITYKFGNKNIKAKRERNSNLEESKRM